MVENPDFARITAATLVAGVGDMHSPQHRDLRPSQAPRTAMILAAGRGRRMRQLTSKTPKPLLCVAGEPLIFRQIRRLVRAGIERIVINSCWQAEQLEQSVGNGSRWQIEILWSREQTALETGGGVLQALPLLGTEPFLLVNGDVFFEIDTSLLALDGNDLAHLVLVDNPPHHMEGDFLLHGDRVIDRKNATDTLTFAGISIIAPALFNGAEPGVFTLASLLRRAMARQRVGGQHYSGYWMDVGTPERLAALQTRLQLQLATTNEQD